MGKKRKAGGRPAGAKKEDFGPTKFDIEERFDDSEDEFQAGRDQILLEEAPEAKRRRKLVEDEAMLQPSDEEIMGYDSADDDDDDLDDEDDYQEDGYDDDDMDDMPSKSKKRAGSQGSGSEDEEEGIAAWGSSKKDFYNADQIETEADALEEEEEAKRLQQKHLQSMNEEDFGFDETEWADSGKADEAEQAGGEVTEVLPQLEITEDMSAEEKMKILKSRYPEFEPLSKDFLDLQPTHLELKKAAETFNANDDSENAPEYAPASVVKFRALSAYLGTISLYFMLLTSGKDAAGKPIALSPAELRAHPVMATLVKFRKLWESVKDLTEPESESEPSDISESELEEDEISDASEIETETKKDKKQKKKTKAQLAAEARQAEAEARRAKRLQETEANLADLSKLVTAPGKKRAAQKVKNVSKDADDSDFGDEDALTAKEAEEKAKQKRSLRFYTSQLAQKANKRTAAGRDAGGDADLPYRERLRDRQARLNAEAEKRGKQKLKESEQLGGDSDEEDNRVAKQLRGEESDSDDYYDMVAARSKQRKDDKKARAEAEKEAARAGGYVEVQEEVGPDGKRAITYQIEKNKGLAPKRSKDSRNPRVKKRKKFEEKKKKLGSIRQVYKGGEGRGGYGGELTGIKKNLVKSVKL
ncbi:something about silencing 10 family protein [Aspergillus saccharolyticus JOP 1030-1]|uniref:Sas10 C-terminal domain-containing protein n=1 Tax=Aspergillus saccharolyticus JOP 1030-1 TaxID=1450539 RepID=A0A318ZDL9_9EURO|nr:hypothetical protein BP01DRAFT_392636 [Aspergillus saccharolyticus JOP 1030-1]PYH44394.1 hypothetical protein BP01DRAFT_392636 [Aspergillus saccharolyticus JOP 1030-1]